MAGSTRLELATSGVTGRRSNQLNYDPGVEPILARQKTEERRQKRFAAILSSDPVERPALSPTGLLPLSLVPSSTCLLPFCLLSSVFQRRRQWAVQDSNL
jgi:hypothetical protein